MFLHKCEFIVYCIIWISCFVYCFYNVYINGNELHNNGLLENNDLTKGWNVLNRYKDVSDSDWVLWTTFLFNLMPWIFFHLIFCELFRYYNVEAIPLCHAMVTFLVLHFYFPIITSIVLISQFLLFYFVTATKSKILIWILGVIFLILINSIPTLLKAYYITHYDDIALSTICLGWFLIKCIDCSLSELNRCDTNPKRFFDFLAYAFYLPCFFLGPFIPYDYFVNKLYTNFKRWSFIRLISILIDIMKYSMWYLIYEISAHYFYCHSMHYYPEVLISLGIWTLSGVGLCMAQFFFIKYVVIYGTSIAIARAEGYPVPEHPKCINRIYLYSDMWRNFDKGFYLFIFRCIYQPTCGRTSPKLSKKLFASFVCFCFVFVWHGINLTIFYWCLLNFLGLTLEALWNVSKKTKIYNVLKVYIGAKNSRRFHALVASPLWIMAIISNFIFFGGHKLGIIYVQEIINGSWVASIVLIVIAYCMSQISIETDNLQKLGWLCNKKK